MKQSIISATLGVSIVALLGVVNTAQAQGTVIGKFGLLGGGLEYVYPISPKFAVGVGYNGLSLDGDIEESGIDYKADRV